MKNALLTVLLTISYFLTFGQTLTQNINNRLLQDVDFTARAFSLSPGDFDFSPLFTKTDNSVIYGFIGDNYQRIRIKLLTVTKNRSLPGSYLIDGKSMVKNNICEFTGTITISGIRKYKIMSCGVDETYKNKGIKGQYVILGNYNFIENKAQPYSGTFRGVFQSNFYLDKSGKVHYDDIDETSDGYINNQFIGRWIADKGNVIKRCNWGDFRIPFSGHFDIGAGDFSPDDQYLKFGWQSVRDLMNPKTAEKAKQIEEAKWWEQ
jgi:hypothetical protein